MKSPVDLLVGGIRSTGVLPEWWAALPNRMASLGQNLFEAPNVAGWPGGQDWVTPLADSAAGRDAQRSGNGRTV